MNGTILGQVVATTLSVSVKAVRVVLEYQWRGKLDVPNAASEMQQQCTTDDNGWFQAVGLVAGRWRIQAAGAMAVFADVFDYATTTVTLALGLGFESSLAEDSRWGSSDDLCKNNAPELLGGISGQVVFASDGSPVRQASILVIRGPRSVPDISPMTDEWGRFSIEGLAPGIWSLRAIGEQGSSIQGSVFVHSGSFSELQLVLQEGG
jgi:uncharacterized GH25 family protein